MKGYLTVGVKGKDRHGIRVDNPEARWCQFPRGKSILAGSSRVLFVKLASPQQVVYIFCPPVDFLWSQLLDARTPHTFLPHECQSRFHSLATETASQLSRASDLSERCCQDEYSFFFFLMAYILLSPQWWTQLFLHDFIFSIFSRTSQGTANFLWQALPLLLFFFLYVIETRSL